MSKIIKIILYTIIALPLVITPFTIFPHHFGKAFIFQILVDLGLIILLIERWRDHCQLKKIPRLFKWFALVIVIMLIASLWGENFVRSFEGTYFRNNGLVLWLHLLAFFFILSQTFRAASEWRRLLSVTVMVGALVAAIGVGQRFFTVWPGLIDQNGRVASTIGNPIFLGAYLLFPLFLAWYLAATSATTKEKTGWAALAFINLAGIYFTESGGVFVGLISGALVLTVILGLKGSLVRLIKNPLVIGGLVIVLIPLTTFFLFYFKIIPGSKLISPLDRVANISFKLGTGQTRLWAWGMAIEGIKARPWLGWGVANFETVADRYYNPRFIEHSFAETVWDRPHNIYLEVAAEQGLVGLIIYLGLFVSAYSLIARAKNWTPLLKGLISGLLTAYLVQNFFGLDTVSSLISLVVLLALISASEPIKESNEFLPQRKKMFLVIIVGLSLFSLWQWSIKPLRAAYDVNQAAGAVEQDGEEWENNALVVLNYYGFYADQFKLDLARDILNWDSQGNLPYLDLKKGFHALVAGLEEAIKRRPNHFNYHYYLGQLYQIEAEYADKTYFDKSVVMLNKAQELSPERQAVAFMLAKNYFLANDFMKAKAVLDKLIEKYPDNPDVNLQYGLVLSKLGEKNAAARQLVKYMIGNDVFSDTYIPLNIGQIIEADGQYEQMIIFYSFLSAHHPSEPLWLFELAKAYYLDKKPQEAEATILKMRVLIKDNGNNLDAVWKKFKAQNRK